ncbi:MAG: LacI family DNA-binding transcriptional regulator [Phycisphaerae bacterium]
MGEQPTHTIVRLSDIARAAGVTSATVSYALSGRDGVSAGTRQRILTIAERLGYIANRQAAALRGLRSYILGVIVTNIKNPFFAEIVCGVEKAAAKRRYRLMLCVTENNTGDEARHLKMLLEHNVDGLILVPVASDPDGSYENIKWLRMFCKRRKPVLCIVDSIPDLKAASITTDVYEGTRVLLEHLIQLGHRDIAYFSQPFARIRKCGRHAAYHDALAKARIPFRPELLVETGVTPEEAYEKTGWMLDQGIRFTAAVYPNDYMAIGGLRKLRERGLRVPEDVSVTGFDDVELARFCEVPLTTARFQTRRLGEMAVREMIASIERGPEPARGAGLRSIVLRPELIVRESTGPAPQSKD